MENKDVINSMFGTEEGWANHNALQTAVDLEPDMSQSRRQELEKLARMMGDDFDEDAVDQYDAEAEYRNQAVNHLNAR